MKFTSLTEALDENVNADKTTTISYIKSKNDRVEISYQHLKKQALTILFNLQKRGIKKGDQLIIVTDDNELLLYIFWAALYGGIIPVPVATPTTSEHYKKLLLIFDKLETPWIYNDERITDKVIQFCDENNLPKKKQNLTIKTVNKKQITDRSQAGICHKISPNDTAFIQYSSGSTSTPKGVVLTHKNLLTNIYAIIERAEFSRQEIFFGWMPLTHDMGMIGFHLTPLVHNVSQILMNTNMFARRPLSWMQIASEKKATILCSPNFGYKHFLKVFNKKGIDDINLASVRLIFNGAEPISLELCQQFTQALTKYQLHPEAMYPVYGLAEACLVVCFNKPQTPLNKVMLLRDKLNVADKVEHCSQVNKAVTFVDVGYPINNCQVRFTNRDNKILADEHVGKLQIKGDNVTAGYYQADEINQQLITEDGWLDTGDVGCYIAEKIYITGRIKDIIFINGLNYYSHDLEAIIHPLDNLELGKVVATGVRKINASEDEIIIFILHRGELSAFMKIKEAVEKILIKAIAIEINHVIPVKSIPKTTSGKVQRHLLNTDYIEGKFDTVIDEIKILSDSQAHRPSDPQTDKLLDDKLATLTVAQQILAICNSIINDKTITIEDNLFEIGISSLTLAEIHEKIDEVYPNKVDVTDLFDHPTVKELAAFLQ